MELAYTIFAKAAELNSNGIFSLIGGGFNGIVAPSFPAMTPPVAFLVHVRLQPEEIGRQFRIRIDVIAPDGTALPAGEDLPFTPVRASSNPDRVPGYTFLLQVYGVQLPMPGEYQFRLSVDGRVLGAVPLFVEEAPELAVAQTAVHYHLPNSKLRAIAARHRPPQSWYDDNTKPF